MPKLRVGGASTHWVSESIKATQLALDNADKITIPVLLMQACAESIVDNQAQIRFIETLNRKQPLGQLLPVHGSRHEIFFEKDEQRNVSIKAIVNFFNQQIAS